MGAGVVAGSVLLTAVGAGVSNPGVARVTSVHRDAFASATTSAGTDEVSESSSDQTFPSVSLIATSSNCDADPDCVSVDSRVSAQWEVRPTADSLVISGDIRHSVGVIQQGFGFNGGFSATTMSLFAVEFTLTEPRTLFLLRESSGLDGLFGDLRDGAGDLVFFSAFDVTSPPFGEFEVGVLPAGDYRFSMGSNDVIDNNSFEFFLDRDGRYELRLPGPAEFLDCEAPVTGCQAGGDFCNGDFEAQDLSEWHVSDPVGTQVQPADVLRGINSFGDFPNGEWTCLMNTGGAGAGGLISQTIATTAGAAYELGFGFGQWAPTPGLGQGSMRIAVRVFDDACGSLILETEFSDPTGTNDLALIADAYVVPFTAASQRTRIEFEDLSPVTGFADLLIDDVALNLVPPCNAADLSAPLGVLDLTDVDAFIAAFAGGDPAADLAPPVGVIDLGDIDVFIAAFLGGCP